MIDIKNKTCLVVLLGKSVEELEERIESFKDADIVWCSISNFDIPQKYILDKINKKIEIVYDSGTVANAEDYERKYRLPRLSKYLDKEENNLYISTNNDKNNLYELRERIAPEFNLKYRNKIIYTSEIGIDPNSFCVSLHLYIACLYKLGCSQVILFGADGDKPHTYNNHIDSYYKSDLIKADKIACGNLVYNLVGDSDNINKSYVPLLTKTLGYVPEVLNCSLDSSYSVFKKVSYDKVINLLK